MTGTEAASLEMIDLQVDRGTGFALLAMDTTPNYTDTFAPTAPAKWTYRGIYRVGDTRVGQWSSEVSINVAPWRLIFTRLPSVLALLKP